MKTAFIFLIFSALFCRSVFADSPLTSTQFSTVYKGEAIVIKASEANGILSKEIMDYLVETSNPIEIKMAVINQLGWNFDGKNNAKLFCDYLKKKKGYSNENDIAEKADAGIILCLAYIKAMDNYFVVDEALKMAETAVKENPESYTFNIICALIKAQKVMDSDWCEVFKATDEVRNNKSLKIDMKEEAMGIIFEYMDLYRDSCK